MKPITNNFNLCLKVFFYAVLIQFFDSTAWAAQDLPLEIDAGTSDCGTDLENCTLSFNGVIRQGDANITADQLYSISENAWELSGNISIEKTGMTIVANQATISLSERQLQSFVLVGSPVSFRYLVGDNSKANGQANKISFNLNTRMISLDGDAQLFEAGNELKGQNIEYDIDAERLKANNKGKGNERVRLVFEPPSKTKNENENEPVTETGN